jgi:hypothetical protein
MYALPEPDPDDKRNMYEIRRDRFHEERAKIITASYGHPLEGGLMDLVIDYIAPYVCRTAPYAWDMRNLAALARAFKAASADPRSSFFHLSASVIERIISFLRPRVLMTEPIPCAITTIGVINDFDYDQEALITAIKARGAAGLLDPRIQSVANQKGYHVALGASDPRDRPAKKKHGKKAEANGNVLFGTSQTTFRVKTYHRDPSKVFAIKVFQKKVSFETLGGLWVDCRDTRDVNETVLIEMRAALGRPDINIDEFIASMRNYRFRLLGGYNIRLDVVRNIFQKMNKTTHPNIYATVDINRYPSAIIEIDVPHHTSRKKKLTVKMFQSGKINLDSSVFYDEHIYYWYRFINDFFIKHAEEVLYLPIEDDDYNSDYYYAEAGVDPPPYVLVDDWD